MIAYKWVIKKDNKYVPLRNFGIDALDGIQKHISYKMHKVYKCPKGRKKSGGYFCIPGFHFWGNTSNIQTLENWNRFLKKRNQPTINCILICEIEDIIKQRNSLLGNHIICKKFKVLEEKEVSDDYSIRF